MLIVIPVSKADEHMMGPMTELIVKLGGCLAHDLLVVGSHDCKHLVEKLELDLNKQFKNTSMFMFDCPITGWPLGPNAYFRNTASYLAYTIKNTQPWYWFELDNTPLKSGWADSLQQEYGQTGAVFMGAKHPTFYANRQTNELFISGNHMAGTGIYPANFADLSYLWKYEEGIAFDVWIQGEVAKVGITDTRLIQHNWKSINYRIEDGVIVCDNLPLPHPDLKFNTPLREDAVVLHGCKDNSLPQLILNKLNGKTTEIAASTPIETEVVVDTTTNKKIRKKRTKKSV
jgi:hypothetical protein